MSGSLKKPAERATVLRAGEDREISAASVGYPERSTLSLVVPFYNEEEGIDSFYRAIVPILEGIPGTDFEVVCVDDGSRDRTLDLLLDLSRKDPRFRVVELSRNFGKEAALTAGIDAAEGEAVVPIDADLQDPPEVIPDLVARWREGYQVVYAVRAKREGETFFKKATASLFYRLIRRITSVDIPVDTGDFRLMDRQVVDALGTIREKHRFVRGLVSWVGFRQIGVPYVRHERLAGETKYPLKKMLKFAFDGITSFSFLPLQMATYLGFAVSGVSFLVICWVLFEKLLGRQPLEPGWASVMTAVLFLGGVQLITIGLIGEYVGRIYDEVKERPLYILKEEIGVAASAPSPVRA